jgi:hypothetical protein
VLETYLEITTILLLWVNNHRVENGEGLIQRGPFVVNDVKEDVFLLKGQTQKLAELKK